MCIKVHKSNIPNHSQGFLHFFSLSYRKLLISYFSTSTWLMCTYILNNQLAIYRFAPELVSLILEAVHLGEEGCLFLLCYIFFTLFGQNSPFLLISWILKFSDKTFLTLVLYFWFSPASLDFVTSKDASTCLPKGFSIASSNYLNLETYCQTTESLGVWISGLGII